MPACVRLASISATVAAVLSFSLSLESVLSPKSVLSPGELPPCACPGGVVGLSLVCRRGVVGLSLSSWVIQSMGGVEKKVKARSHFAFGIRVRASMRSGVRAVPLRISHPLCFLGAVEASILMKPKSP